MRFGEVWLDTDGEMIFIVVETENEWDDAPAYKAMTIVGAKDWEYWGYEPQTRYFDADNSWDQQE